MVTNLWYISVIILTINSIVLFYFLIRLYLILNKNTEQKKEFKAFRDTLSKIDNIIEHTVIYLNQSTVEDLKEADNFIQQDREEIFKECKKLILSHIDNIDTSKLSRFIKDLDLWIDNRIEYYVLKEKQNKISL